MDDFKILLITTGGTIGRHTKNRNNEDDYEDPTDKSLFQESIEDIEERLNDIASKQRAQDRETYVLSSIKIIKVLDKDSAAITPTDWKVLIETIIENYNNYDAFVITHGTNTMGYTSAALSFALGNLAKPIILTGAQVSFGHSGSDAQTNLENAIRIASYAREKLRGVMVVFGSSIITGTRAKKRTQFDYDAFKSFNTGTIGKIGNYIQIDSAALNKHISFLGAGATKSDELDIKDDFDMSIASLTEYPGMDSNFIKALVMYELYPIKGIILRATGAGDPNILPINKATNCSADLREGFEFLREKEIPIVVTTQAPDGVASMDINEPGVEAVKLGAIPAHDMSMESMSVKLAWLLGRKLPYEVIREQMVQSIRGEILIGSR